MTRSENRILEIKLTAAQVAAFRDFSRDHNPLHTDAEYSRRTQFGRPVVFGVAGVLAAISAWTDGRRFELASLRARFDRPLFADETYSLQITEANGQTRLQISKGGQLHLRVTLCVAPGEPSAALPEGKAAFAGQRSVANDWEPASAPPTVPNPFPYSPDWKAAGDFERAFRLRADQLPGAQLSALLWSSYFVGMEFPGKQALFTELDFVFKPPSDATEPFVLRDLATAYDARFGLANISGSGTGIASLQITALCRPRPVSFSWEEIRAALGDGPKFQDRTFFISGATRGFGEVLAKSFMLRGGKVVLNQRTEAASAIAGFAQVSPESFVISGDVSRAEDCEQMREAVLARFGKLDYLICNAFPPIGANPFLGQSAGDFQNFVLRALSASTELLHAFLPRLESGATVIYISTIYTVRPREQFSHYIAAKCAAEGLLRALAQEFKPLRFVIVRPSKMLTDQTNLAFDREPPASPIEICRRLLAALPTLGPERNLFELDL